MKRTGPLRDRIALRALRMSVGAWRLGERLGVDLIGSSEAPPYRIDGKRRAVFERLTRDALARDGTVDAGACAYPLHDLLTYLVEEQRFLLHGTNDTSVELLQPRPARDFATELVAVVATDDGIWPMFYAVIDRARVDGVFTGCTRLGSGAKLRRFYVFVAFTDDAAVPWTNGVVYALPRETFRREWGAEWVSSEPVRPRLRIPVTPTDFPLSESVLALPPAEAKSVIRRLRAAKREHLARD
jgi:hypothetical protein